MGLGINVIKGIEFLKDSNGDVAQWCRTFLVDLKPNEDLKNKSIPHSRALFMTKSEGRHQKS